MIDERSKRKPNFDECNSAPVVLADGQRWHVPKPWLEIRPVFHGGRAVRAHAAITSGPDLDAMIDAVADAEDRVTQISLVASLAAHLLLWHYALDDDELDQLLAFRLSDEASAIWIREIFAIATGQSGPKV
jgi:hypothetical protein